MSLAWNVKRDLLIYLDWVTSDMPSLVAESSDRNRKYLAHFDVSNRMYTESRSWIIESNLSEEWPDLRYLCRASTFVDMRIQWLRGGNATDRYG